MRLRPPYVIFEFRMRDGTTVTIMKLSRENESEAAAAAEGLTGSRVQCTKVVEVK